MTGIGATSRDGRRASGHGGIRRRALAAALLAPLLVGCAPYLRTDMPTPRQAGARDALASLLGACGAPSPGAAPEAGAVGDDRRARRSCIAEGDVTSTTPAGPTQKKP